MYSASHINYYHLCHRKLWIHHKGLRQEDNSQAVGEGKLIGKNTYVRRANRWRELALGSIKIDHFDPKEKIVKEVKKSPKLDHAHIAQLQYYLYVLEKAGVRGAKGILEYPKQRKSRTVELTTEIRKDIQHWEEEIARIVSLPRCPTLVNKTYCRQCAYQDFCFI